MHSFRLALLHRPVPILLALGLPVFLVNYFAGRPGISGWDANFYYAYAGAIAETGRVDLDWAYAEMVKRGADPTVFDFRQRSREGRAYNYFPIGHPLPHVPAALLGKFLSGAFERRGFSAFGPTAQLFYCLSCIATAALGIALMRRAVAGLLGAEAAGAALWALMATTMLGYYWFVLPALSHTTSLLVMGLLLAVFMRVAGSGSAAPAWLFGALGAAIGYMIAVRLQDVAFAAFGLTALWLLVQSGLPTRAMAGRAAALLAGGALGLLPQMLLWKWKDGAWIYLGYHELMPEKYFFTWSRPHLVDILFSPRHGLFFWHPALLAAAAGFMLWLKEATKTTTPNDDNCGAGETPVLHSQPHTNPMTAPLAAALLLSFLGLWYIGASFSVWWFGDSFGSRPFLSALPLFWIGAAWLWARARRSAPGRRIFWSAVAALGAWNALLAVLFHLGRIPRGDALTLAALLKGLGL